MKYSLWKEASMLPTLLESWCQPDGKGDLLVLQGMFTFAMQSCKDLANWQSLVMYPQLASNWRSSCCSCPNPGITDVFLDGQVVWKGSLRSNTGLGVPDTFSLKLCNSVSTSWCLNTIISQDSARCFCTDLFESSSPHSAENHLKWLFFFRLHSDGWQKLSGINEEQSNI